ncbi:MAG: pyridoxamine 5'-phosphate oxidase family protein [Verrucomicrobiota bacterium]
MNLQDALKPGGKGIMATASKSGAVNTAVYAVPHIVDGETLVWGMTDGRTWDNVRENPNAVYTYFAPGEGFRGVRLGLSLVRSEDSGETLAMIRQRAASASPAEPEKIRHAVYFKVTETRPLV